MQRSLLLGFTGPHPEETLPIRLPLIAPADLSAEQKPLYEDMKDGITSNSNHFVAVRDDDALMGLGTCGCTGPGSAALSGR